MATLFDVQAKLTGGWSMSCLPISVLDPAWDKVQSTCRLSDTEVKMLKDEIARMEAGGSNTVASITINKLDAAYCQVLHTYLSRGAALQESADEISQSLEAVMEQNGETCYCRDPKLFFFIEASSGEGKSQLAFSLRMPVVYIPMSTGQCMYECFGTVAQRISTALDYDLDLMRNRNRRGALVSIRSNSLSVSGLSFRTVGLLVALFKAVHGRSNADSLKILSGYDSPMTAQYAPMTVNAARKSIAQFEAERSTAGAESATAYKYQTPLFFIDEAPAGSDTAQYARCILLRNLIRSMQCVCLLVGTEAAAMGAIDNVQGGSRVTVWHEYMRLITRLPPTRWEIFANDTTGNYSALMPSDVCTLLKRTRPLFVEYVLDSMLKIQQDAAGSAGSASPSSSFPTSCDTSTVSPTGPLTAAVLSVVKLRILRTKQIFHRDAGLYAQLALLHGSFLQRTVDEMLACPAAVNAVPRDYSIDRPTYPSHKRTYDEMDVEQKPLTVSERKDLVRADKRICVRHHFGRMRAANTYVDPHRLTLSLMLNPDGLRSSIKVAHGDRHLTEMERFIPNVTFAPPSDDKLLCLICCRDGVYHRNAHDTRVRIATSYALTHLHELRRLSGLPLFESTTQGTSCCKYLEAEIASAAVVASHSYPTLSGCPLSYFLRALIAELNVNPQYTPVEVFDLQNMPARYDDVMIGLLSPSNSPWRQSTQPSTSTHRATTKKGSSNSRVASGESDSNGVTLLQDGSIFLGDLTWSADKDSNGGMMPVLHNGAVRTLSLEVHLHHSSVCGADVARNIENTKQRNHLISIILVSKAAMIQVNKGTFNKAKQGVNLVRITGNASNQLKWVSLHEADNAAELLNAPTVVVIELDTIYHDRYAQMQDKYQPPVKSVKTRQRVK